MSLLQSFQSVFSASRRSANPSWLANPPAKLPTAPTPLFGHDHHHGDDDHGDTWTPVNYIEATEWAQGDEGLTSAIERAEEEQVSIAYRDVPQDEVPDDVIEVKGLPGLPAGIVRVIQFVCPGCVHHRGANVEDVIAHNKTHEDH